MFTLIVTALLASSAPNTAPPCCTAAVSNAEIARCTSMVLIENRISEQDARRIRAGAPTSILGVEMIFEQNDSYWRLCKKRIAPKKLA